MEKKIYKRQCPKCQRTVKYNWYSNWSIANKHKRLCKWCTNKQNARKGAAKISATLTGRKLSLEHRAKVIKAGKKNIIQGNMHDFWIKKYGKEEADRCLKITKAKHSKNNSGKGNPMYGKPSPQGSGNGWSGWYKDWFFRSLRELKYVLELDEQDIFWESAECEKYKVKYVCPRGIKRNYFPDFLVENNKIVECKPKKLWNTPLVQTKVSAAKDKFAQMGFEFELFDPGTFDEKEFKILWNSGIIVMTDRYQQKALEKFNG